jgi:hypothetical protein
MAERLIGGSVLRGNMYAVNIHKRHRLFRIYERNRGDRALHRNTRTCGLLLFGTGLFIAPARRPPSRSVRACHLVWRNTLPGDIAESTISEGGHIHAPGTDAGLTAQPEARDQERETPLHRSKEPAQMASFRITFDSVNY